MGSLAFFSLSFRRENLDSLFGASFFFCGVGSAFAGGFFSAFFLLFFSGSFPDSAFSSSPICIPHWSASPIIL